MSHQITTQTDTQILKFCGDFGGKSRQTGQPCKRVAGHGSPTPGHGKCRLHGGCSTGRPPSKPTTILARAAKNTALIERAEDKLRAGFDVHNLDRVAAITHVLIDDLSAEHERDAIKPATIGLLLQCLEIIRKTADTQERIKTSAAFGSAERAAFIVALHDFTRHIDEVFPRCTSAEQLQNELRSFLESHPLLNIRGAAQA